MAREVQNYNKYENYIRVGHTATGSFGNYVCSDLQNFPTPATLIRNLHDVDVDAFTDLEGFTHRNRARNNVEDIEVTFPVCSDVDTQTILGMINYEWIYVELINKRTGNREIHKMYASDKKMGTFTIWKDTNNVWHTEDIDLTFSLTEE